MNEAIKLAIEKGGYKKFKGYDFDDVQFIPGGTLVDLINTYSSGRSSHTVAQEEVLLDPLFWQALSKALGWSGFKFYFQGEWQYTDDPSIQVQSRTPFVYETWLSNALDYHELVLTGGDVDAFWKGLLDEKL